MTVTGFWFRLFCWYVRKSAKNNEENQLNYYLNNKNSLPNQWLRMDVFSYGFFCWYACEGVSIMQKINTNCIVLQKDSTLQWIRSFDFCWQNNLLIRTNLANWINTRCLALSTCTVFNTNMYFHFFQINNYFYY